ncbi:homoserine kinase [Rhodoferax sp. 4810]|nr:homoserine kinase [Rhodoferax jenense]
MAVYTEVSEPEARNLLRTLGLGELTSLRPCAGGIENTNYFASTELAGQPHDYVLTLFERLSIEQLPFYLRLMKHLAQRGILVPEPHANPLGELVFEVKGKPAAVVDKLRGKSELTPTEDHCTQVGATLARLHLAGQDFALTQPNLRALPWWNEVAPVLLPHLTGSQQALLQSELAYQNQVATRPSYAALPRGPIHADLFRDNVMFDTLDGQPHLSGFFDFYFAGVDSFVFDLAVCLNDWCIDPTTGAHHAQRAHAFVAAYETVRPLQAGERELLSPMLRAGALRFWVSRLWDFVLPRTASVLHAHDAAHFERVLQQRIRNPLNFDQLALTA